MSLAFFHSAITKVPSTSPPPLPVPLNVVNSQFLSLLVLLEHPPCPPAQHLSPTHCPSCHYFGVHLVLMTSWTHSVFSTPFLITKEGITGAALAGTSVCSTYMVIQAHENLTFMYKKLYNLGQKYYSLLPFCFLPSFLLDCFWSWSFRSQEVFWEQCTDLR